MTSVRPPFCDSVFGAAAPWAPPARSQPVATEFLTPVDPTLVAGLSRIILQCPAVLPAVVETTPSDKEKAEKEKKAKPGMRMCPCGVNAVFDPTIPLWITAGGSLNFFFAVVCGLLDELVRSLLSYCSRPPGKAHFGQPIGSHVPPCLACLQSDHRGSFCCAYPPCVVQGSRIGGSGPWRRRRWYVNSCFSLVSSLPSLPPLSSG
jgi:hypothetical protein